MSEFGDFMMEMMTFGMWESQSEKKSEEGPEDPETLDTGALDGATAKELARKRMFREGTVFTSASGLTNESTVASAKIK